MRGLASRFVRLYTKLLGRFMVHLHSHHRKLRVRYPLSPEFVFAKQGELHFIKDKKGDSLYLSFQHRVYLYASGVAKRIEALADEYLLRREMVAGGRVFVDVGANVGELALWSEPLGARYFGFEPDPRIFAALNKNVKNGKVFQVALGEVQEKRTLFLKSDTADTSLVRPSVWDQSDGSVEVQVEQLDTVLGTALPTGNIDLLKIEAEGFEPEILAGAQQTLKRTVLLAVDAGPEREGRVTLPAVLDILVPSGFRVIEKHPARQTYLFKNETVQGT